MDPSITLSLLTGIIDSVQWAFGAIEKVQHAEVAERDELRKLKTIMSIVGNDISTFKQLISALQSSENDRFYSTFIQRDGARDAMNKLDRALRGIAGLLEVQHGPLPSNPRPYSLRPVLELVICLPHTERRSTVSDLNDVTRNVLNSLQETKSAFKLVWYLYILSRQPITPEGSDTRAPTNPALDMIHSEFTSHPFAISRPAQPHSHAPFLVLNRDPETATQKEELAKRLGKDWIVNYLYSHNGSSSPLLEAQIALFELVWSGTVQHLKGNPTHNAEDPEYTELQQTLDQLDKSLQAVIARSQQHRYALSFYGMVQAGKSLFLNAMIGERILPSDELSSTAWPCRLVHVKGQVQPELSVRTQPFDRAIQTFRKHEYASKMQSYRPPTVVDGLDSQIEPSGASELRNIYEIWIGLHLSTRINLSTFEGACFKLSDRASGAEGVKDLLAKINDIVRLCRRFGVRFDGTEDDWPILSVEFSSLKDRKTNVVYEFIDLPGINEQFEISSWESLVRLAASQSNAIVPVVSFTELYRSDWKCLPELAAKGYNRKPGLVVCTHLDQVSQDNLQLHLWTVSSTFWPDSPNDTSRLLKCSSLMGLSANQLLEQSETTKPPFKDVWDPASIGYHCASRILGKGDPEAVYNYYDRNIWRDKVKQKLDASGLRDVLQKLTHDIDNARENALISETKDAIRLIKELRKRAGRKLLNARRTRDDFATATREYEESRERLQKILVTWGQEEETLINESRQQLQKAYLFLSRKAERFIQSALQATLKYVGEAEIQVPGVTIAEDASRITESVGQLDADLTDKVLMVKSTVQAEEIFCRSQKLLHNGLHKLIAEYVNAIRHLGEAAKASRIEALRTALQRDDLQTELRDNIIELESQLVDTRELAYSQIRGKIKTSFTRYTAEAAFQTIEAKIARWWFNPASKSEQSSEGERPSFTDRDSNHVVDSPPTLRDDDDEVEEAAGSSIEQLGFMLRAPLTAVTSIVWTVNAPTWVFIPQSHTYHLPMKEIQQQYKDMIVQPWLESLNKEGEKTLLGTISLTSSAAKGILDRILEREAIRYTRESETEQKPLDDMVVDNLVTASVNLLAAEEALQELNRRMRGRLS